MSDTFDFGGEFVWEPTSTHIQRSNLKRFMDLHHIVDMDELQRRSTGNVAWFTEGVLEFLDIRFSQPYSQVVDLSRGIAR